MSIGLEANMEVLCTNEELIQETQDSLDILALEKKVIYINIYLYIPSSINWNI